MKPLPTGTVTFLFTDIEGSAKLWENYPEQMRAVLARHDALLRSAVEASGGVVFKTVGDAFCAAFASAPAALEAAVAAQGAFHEEPWPDEMRLRVRMALHTGIAQERDHDYFGPALNRVARLLTAGHGGQTLVSAAAYELVRDHLPTAVLLRALGSHRLKDLERPEEVYQLVHPDLDDGFPPLRTLDVTPNNLPQQLTSFIGREKEGGEIRKRLGKTRLLTLTGSGGCGKSRLGLQAAADVLDTYPDGVWVVELAPLSDLALVPQTVAAVLGVKEQAGQPFTQTLVEYGRNKRFLLVLDNSEHLLSACALLVTALLRACADVHILATSREPLGVTGEAVYRVPSLSLPDVTQARAATPAMLRQFEAARLFIERAELVRADFAVSSGNAPAIAQLCYRLDGIPLAIELAAARVRSLSVEQINDKLDSRFRLLTSSDRSALPRQQTLRALVDWSYDLLREQERTLLARLSVFVGGWTLEAAESVCGFGPVEEWDVLDLLTSLVDKSLVVAEEDGDATRYRLLETLRQYAVEKLRDSGSTGTLAGRHRDWCVAFAEHAEPELSGPEQGAWLDRVETEHDNLRAALAGSPQNTDEGKEAAGTVLRLAGALWRFWYVRGYYTEGRAYLARALDLMPTSRTPLTRAKALRAAGVLAMVQGDYPTARVVQEEALVLYRGSNDKKATALLLSDLGFSAHFQVEPEIARARLEESLTLNREIGNKQGMASTLLYLALLASDQGNDEVARVRQEEALALYRELGDKDGIGGALNNLGLVAQQQGQLETARARHEEALVLCRETNSLLGMADTLNNLAYVASRQGDHRCAQASHEEALSLHLQMGNKQGITDTLHGFAQSWLYQGRVRQAVVLWAATDALRQSLGAPLPLNRQSDYQEYLEEAQALLGNTAYTTAWNEGHSLTLNQAADYARKPINL